MAGQRRAFQLPMTTTISVGQRDGRFIAHALDFDIVCTGETEDDATDKLALSIKTYIEYGLSKGWSGDILFPAPTECWDRLSPDTPVKLMPPIFIDDRRMLVVRATPAAIAHEPGRVACPA
jgi:hypothetical protein